LRLEAHVDAFGVASIDEALALRNVGIKIPITLMEGVFEPQELMIAAQENLHVVFHHACLIAWLDQIDVAQPLTAWLIIDTGMGRLGFSGDERWRAYERLACSQKIQQPCGIMSHFACADQPDHPLNHLQIEQFYQFTHELPGLKSLCNSAGIFSFPQAHYDVVRPGISLYGISPCGGITAEQLGLKPVMSMHTRLISVRYVKRGSSIGYGAHYVCPEDMPIGVIALGYGDVLVRTAREGMPVLVNGVKCHVVGRVSMDMMTVDLRRYPQAQVGEPVTLWGEGLPLEEVTVATSHGVYDMLTGVQPRVAFYWT
jgi:alanine racemase